MTIYIVRNERDEEVAAYTSPKPAESIAAELQSATLQPYSVEKLVVE